jgi:hypothetical protein
VFSITSTGSFKKTSTFLEAMARLNIMAVLNRYGSEGVAALARATPVDSGLAASSWSYEVNRRGGVYEIVWLNTDIENGFPVAIMLQYGYGTGTGGYVAGHDYINPAARPIFDRIADEVWKAVTSA